MPTVETPETTTALGLKLVRTLKASCDKTYVLIPGSGHQRAQSYPDTKWALQITD